MPFAIGSVVRCVKVVVFPNHCFITLRFLILALPTSMLVIGVNVRKTEFRLSPFFRILPFFQSMCKQRLWFLHFMCRPMCWNIRQTENTNLCIISVQVKQTVAAYGFRHTGRKVRATQSKMPANGWAWQHDGKWNRKQNRRWFGFAQKQVRVKRCGKSAPCDW